MTAPTEAHKAALDALEGMVRLALPDSSYSHYVPSELGEPVCQLVHAGRMEWTGKSSARFVTPPKPKLTAEEVAEVMRLATSYAAHAKLEGAAEAKGNAFAYDLGPKRAISAYLTSLTQEGE